MASPFIRKALQRMEINSSEPFPAVLRFHAEFFRQFRGEFPDFRFKRLFVGDRFGVAPVVDGDVDAGKSAVSETDNRLGNHLGKERHIRAFERLIAGGVAFCREPLERGARFQNGIAPEIGSSQFPEDRALPVKEVRQIAVCTIRRKKCEQKCQRSCKTYHFSASCSLPRPCSGGIFFPNSRTGVQTRYPGCPPKKMASA